MKGKNLFFMGLIVLIAGIILIITYQSIKSVGVVITGGILFIVAGVFNIAVYLGRRSEGRRAGVLSDVITWVNCAAGVILGLCMLIFQSTFIGLVPFLFGVLIAFGALYQFFLLGYGCRPARIPWWLFLVPTALAGAAIYLFVQRPDESDPVIMLTTGISLGVLGLAMVVESFIVGHYNREVLKEKKAAALSTETKSDTETTPTPLDPDKEQK